MNDELRMDFHGVTLGWLDPQTLTLNPFNYRTHPDEQRSAIASSIGEHGWVQFPIFNERTGRLIDGHARRQQAAADGLPGIVCVLVDKDEDAEKRLLASLHRTADLAVIDTERLVALVQEAAEAAGAMPAGWTGDSLAALMMEQDRAAAATVAAVMAGTGTRQPETQAPARERTRNVTLKLTEQEFEQYTVAVEQLREQLGLETDKWAVLFALERTAEG